MMPLHFKPEMVHLLTWFEDSPDVGDPMCICSLCGEMIGEDEIPLRVFGASGQTELRLHANCAEQVISPFTAAPSAKPKTESRHRYHPAFTEGQYAFTEGERRGRNPYSASGTQAACHAWWAGWDAAWEERNANQSADQSQNADS